VKVLYVALPLAVAIGVLVPLFFYTAPAQFGPGWQDASPDGGTSLASALSVRGPVRVIEGSEGVLPASAGAGDALFLFPTHRPAAALEIQAVAGFVSRGGLLVMATDGANGDPWARQFGFQLQGFAALLPPGANGSCVRALGVVPDGPPQPICLPSPSAFPDLERFAAVQSGAAAVGNSTDSVFLDLNQDGRLDLGDQGPSPFPMAVRWPHGRGLVIAVADGDLWRNGNVADHPETLAYAQRLVEGKTGTLYLESISAPRGPATAAYMATYRWLSAPSLVEGAALGLVGAALLLAALQVAKAAPWRAHTASGSAEDPALEEGARALLDGPALPKQNVR
jgi:hypothetical protein